MHPLNLNPIQGKPSICFLAKSCLDGRWLWHRRFSNLNVKDINKIVLGDLVRGIPLINYDKDHMYASCKMGKQGRKSDSSIIKTKIVESLELIHIDLCGQ